MEAELQCRDLMAESTCHAGWKQQERTWRNSMDRYTGTYCQTMLAGATAQVQIVFGCPESSPDALP